MFNSDQHKRLILKIVQLLLKQNGLNLNVSLYILTVGINAV